MIEKRKRGEVTNMFGVGLLTGMVLGGIASLFLLCMVIAGSRADHRMEQARSETGEPDGIERSGTAEDSRGKEEGRRIQFVDIYNQNLFCIEDREGIELFYENGDRQTCLCHYLDRRHVSIDGKRWEILAFARRMDKRKIVFIPLSKQRREGGVVA
jgi:hypothetical protein